MKKDIVIVSILFVAIIILALWFSSSPSYIPYSSVIAMGPAKYEGFSSLEYSSTKDNSVVDSSVSEYEINKDTSGSKTVSGFSGYGVFTSPSSQPETIDIYSQAKGSLDGPGYGYYNSQGSIQMDDNMKNQLSTRGMNASGSPSIIGGSVV
jgi:hypothetical protein